MFKIFIFFSAFLFFAANIFTQYTSPESVTFDSVYNRWLITNSGGVIKQRNNATGVVTDFAPAGSGSHGIRIYNGRAYACAGNTIRGFSLATGTQEFSVQLTGASFLNGLGIDQNTGIAYISDFTGQRIYKLNLNTQAWWIYVPSAGGQPNGVYADSPRKRLLICYWGTNAAVKQVNLADSTLTTITNTGYNNCDGIYLDKYDNVYISSWSPSPAKILRYDINFTLPVAIVINSGLSNPADIYINKTGDTLGVPNSGNNTVTFHNIGNISGIQQVNSNIPQKFLLNQNYPNPFNPATRISFDISESSQAVKLSVFNTLGQRVSLLVNEFLTAGSYEIDFNAENLPSGVYYYRLDTKKFSETKKMILLK